MDRFEGGKDPFVLFLNVDDKYECKNKLWNKKDKNNSWTRGAPIKKSEGCVDCCVQLCHRARVFPATTSHVHPHFHPHLS